MDLRNCNRAELERSAIEGPYLERPTEVHIELSLSVHDCASLWDAAALKGLSAPGMRLADLVDVIGPREDPAVAECIAMLAQPVLIPGCEQAHFDVAIVAPRAADTQLRDLKAA
jgi:hypothetical protein